ncbi:sugar kinase [Sandaracinobacteroides hominis]|uniref:sugar kinase n=1 Tax=Sandaracinobacteroides hominis TaxID=2780086 RepID=UPI0018F2D28C|nr:sugar kinase [Sandaracinobacteroides hominis]
MRTVFLGELLVRLSAQGRQLLATTPALDVHVGGAEANVAVGMAMLGCETSMVSAVPDNDFGRRAIAHLAAAGVDATGVLTTPGRMGLYILTPGAGVRASDIVYDRAASSFALLGPGTFDWDVLLAGAGRLHLSGITPALGPNSAALALEAATAAERRDVPISFDGNYRARLWEAWDSNPRAILSELVGKADILFGNHQDIGLLLGKPIAGDGEARRRAAADAAFAAFPKLKLMASTARRVIDADANAIAARLDSRDGVVQTEDVLIAGIVDRIGGGDAFAAGVMAALGKGLPVAEAAEWGLALTALKHSLPGDASLFREADITAFRAGARDVRR